MVYQKQTCLGLFCVQIRSTMMNRFALADITKLQIASHGLAAIAKLPLVCRPLRPHGFVDGIITWFHRHSISPHEQAPEDNKHNAVIGQKGWENIEAWICSWAQVINS
jgi:hypothetical protein